MACLFNVSANGQRFNLFNANAFTIERKLNNIFLATNTKDVRLKGRVKCVRYTYKQEGITFECFDFLRPEYPFEFELNFDRFGKLTTQKKYNSEKEKVEEIKYKYFGDLIAEYAVYNLYDSLSFLNEYKEDSFGNRIPARPIDAFKLSLETKCVIDFNKHQPIKETWYSFDGVSSWSVFKYNNIGNLQNAITFAADGKHLNIQNYVYDNQFLLTKSTGFDKNDSSQLENSIIYQYDEKHNEIAEKYLCKKMLTSETLYKYDSGNRLIKSIRSNDMRLFSFHTYTYDYWGNIAEETQYISENKDAQPPQIFDDNVQHRSLEKWTHRFEKYDAHGNWLRKNTYRNGKHVQTFTRTIKYY